MMRPPTAADMLSAWEKGLAQPPVDRALTLLGAAEYGTSPELLATLPIGQRDKRLMALRGQTFGSQLQCVVDCPACEERAEFALNLADVPFASSATDNNGSASDDGTPFLEPCDCVELDEYLIRFRSPNSMDLTAVAEADDEETARGLLLQRCLTEVHHRGRAIVVDALPRTVIDMVVRRMAEADPQADVSFDMTCPACGHKWYTPFDIASYLWIELDAWARSLLREVHVLAQAYGWREADILAMSPGRRRAYLELVGT